MRACRDDERFSVEAARLNETVGSTPAIAIYSWLTLFTNIQRYTIMDISLKLVQWSSGHLVCLSRRRTRVRIPSGP